MLLRIEEHLLPGKETNAFRLEWESCVINIIYNSLNVVWTLVICTLVELRVKIHFIL